MYGLSYCKTVHSSVVFWLLLGDDSAAANLVLVFDFQNGNP